MTDCQSGTWGKQPFPLAYNDQFYDDGFATSANFCSTGALPVRTYSLSLDKPSLVFTSIVTSSFASSGEVYAGIYWNGLCAFNRDSFNSGGGDRKSTRLNSSH